jgi:hypothetical protein
MDTLLGRSSGQQASNSDRETRAYSHQPEKDLSSEVQNALGLIRAAADASIAKITATMDARYAVYEKWMTQATSSQNAQINQRINDLAQLISQLSTTVSRMPQSTAPATNIPIQIEYSRTTKILRFSTDGGTTWTTIETALSYPP